MRLVDAEPIEKFITDGLNNQEKSYGWVGVEILTEVHYAPTVDATPVVHAHWRRSGNLYICDGETGCGFCMPEEQWYNAHFACPACGAKMDDKENK